MAIHWKNGVIEHPGAVLRFESRDERIMSDVYALVRYAICAGEGGAPVAVRLGDCEFGDHSQLDHAEIDATPEAIAAHAAWVERTERERLAREHAALVAAREAHEASEAKAVRKGRRCRVVRGRKVPKGTEGVCIWVGDGTWGERCGIKDASGTVHWTASKNVEAIAS